MKHLFSHVLFYSLCLLSCDLSNSETKNKKYPVANPDVITPKEDLEMKQPGYPALICHDIMNGNPYNCFSKIYDTTLQVLNSDLTIACRVWIPNDDHPPLHRYSLSSGKDLKLLHVIWHESFTEFIQLNDSLILFDGHPIDYADYYRLLICNTNSLNVDTIDTGHLPCPQKNLDFIDFQRDEFCYLKEGEADHEPGLFIYNWRKKKITPALLFTPGSSIYGRNFKLENGSVRAINHSMMNADSMDSRLMEKQ